MRTTVDLPLPLLTRAKRLAAERRTSLSAITSDALRVYLSATHRPVPDPPFELIVRGQAGARFPDPEEIAAIENEEDIAALRLPGVPRRAAP